MLSQARAVKRDARMIATRYAEAVANNEGTVDFDAFVQMQPRALRGYDEERLRSWFAAVNKSHTGKITPEEMCFFALFKASHGAGSGVNRLPALFDTHDKNCKGQLDAKEFCDVIDSLGFGSAAHGVFMQLDEDQSGHISLTELFACVLRRGDGSGTSGTSSTALADMTMSWYDTQSDVQEAHRIRALGITSDQKQEALELRRRAAAEIGLDASPWAKLGVGDAESLRASISRMLRACNCSVADLMDLFSPDEDGFVTLPAFLETIVYVFGFKGKPKLVEDLFAYLDRDDTKLLGQQQFFELVHTRRSVLRRTSLKTIRTFTLEPKHGEQYAIDDEIEWTEDELRLELQLVLLRTRTSPAELLTVWDKSGDGQLTKMEYLVSMRKLFRFGELVVQQQETVGQILWQNKVKPTAVAIFNAIAGDDQLLSITELETWLDEKWPGMQKASQRRSSVLCAEKNADALAALRAKHFAAEAGMSGESDSPRAQEDSLHLASGFVDFQRRRLSLLPGEADSFEGLALGDRPMDNLAEGTTTHALKPSPPSHGRSLPALGATPTAMHSTRQPRSVVTQTKSASSRQLLSKWERDESGLHHKQSEEAEIREAVRRAWHRVSQHNRVSVPPKSRKLMREANALSRELSEALTAMGRARTRVH